MTVPGVGVLVALGFIATIGDATRFRSAGDVGAFLGLTPRRYQSGETDYSVRISKCGSGPMRALLFEAATSLIQHVRRYSPLKAWAMRLAARNGFMKAAVATALKIAVVLHCVWVDGTEFEWTKMKEATAWSDQFPPAKCGGSGVPRDGGGSILQLWVGTAAPRTADPATELMPR